MTNSNRRQLARVRNAFLGATALAGFAAFATPASAIVINDAFTPTQVVDTTNITGVGQMVVDEKNGFIGLCTASLINPRTVIFASHCVNENPAGNAFMSATGYGAKFGGLPIGFFFNANNNVAGNSAIGQWLNGVSGGPKDLTRTANFAYNANFVVYNTNCCTISLQYNFLQSDIAMAALDTPAVGIPTYTLLFSALSAPAHATITGYGDNGIGTTGQGSIDFKRRTAENLISVLGSLDDQDNFLFGSPDGFPANLYMTDFNDPKFNTAQANAFDFNVFHDNAYTKEGITAPGDSGGPLIVDHQFAAPTIAAVLSGGDRFYPAQPGSSYGTTSFYQPLYLYWDWILANNPYKYVGAKAGDALWTDATHWQMNLDPAYLTISGNALVNALPTTPAKGQTDIPPGFGLICFRNDCIDLKTGIENVNTPAPGPNPTDGSVLPPVYQIGALGDYLGGVDGFRSFVNMFLNAQNGTACAGGPARVSAASLDTGVAVVEDPTSCTADAGGGGDPVPSAITPSAQSNWLNPEGTALVAGVQVQGAPGASTGQAPNDFDGNPTTLAPARYYDVTLAAAGTTTLASAPPITLDMLTINGPNAALTLNFGTTMTTLINTNVFAGTLTVNGTYTDAAGVNMFGGVLQGTGTIVSSSVNFLLGAVAPGTNGTIGSLAVTGALSQGSGSTTAIDFNTTTTDKLTMTGAATVGGTVLFNALTPPQMTDTHIFLQASSISGAYASVPDTIAGVLFPVVTKITAGAVQQEVVSFQAGSFLTQITGASIDQTTIGTALDNIRAGHYNDLLALYQAIDPLAGAALGQALENLAPDAARGTPAMGEMQTDAYDEIIWQRLEGLAGGAGDQQAGLQIDGDGLKSALNSANGMAPAAQQLLALNASVSTNPGGGNAAPASGAPASPSDASEGFMLLPADASGFLTGSSLIGSVAIGGGGGRADVNGYIIAGGLDAPIGHGIKVGGSLGYTDAWMNLRATPGLVHNRGLQGALYGRYDWGNNYIVEAFAAYGRTDINTTRVVTVGPTVFTLFGQTSESSPSAGVYLGRSFSMALDGGTSLHLVPSVALRFSSTSIGGYTETGGVAAMTFAGFSEAGTTSRIGFDADASFHVGDVTVTPNLHAFWVDDLNTRDGSITAAFAGAPANLMTFALVNRDRSYGEFGVGTDVDLGMLLGKSATLSARYDTLSGRSDATYGAWTGRLSIKF